MKIVLKIEKTVCIGAQSCVELDPEHFILEEYDGRAALRKDETAELVRELELDVTEEQKQHYLKVAQLCPTQAISVFDGQGNQLFPL